MTRFVWVFAAGVLVVGLSGCGSSKKVSRMGPAEAKNLGSVMNSEKVQKATKTSTLDTPDYEGLGLKVYPGAKPLGTDAAYVSKGETTQTILYTMVSSDNLAKVTAFYEKELGSKANKLGSDQAIITKKVGDGSKLVSLAKNKEGGTDIKVTVMTPVKK